MGSLPKLAGPTSRNSSSSQVCTESEGPGGGSRRLQRGRWAAGRPHTPRAGLPSQVPISLSIGPEGPVSIQERLHPRSRAE